MLLQSSISSPSSSPQSLSSSLPYSLSFPTRFRSFLPRSIKIHSPSISCSTSKTPKSETVDLEGRPSRKWGQIYKRICLMENPNLGASTVLNQFEDQGRRLTKWELSKVVRELRKFRRYKLALEVYEWMNNQPERFESSSSDTAIQLDLIAKVRGISSAEDYFSRLPDSLKDNRIYGALLNAYAGAEAKDKAESLFDRMRNKGYVVHPLPFNVMMTLYMKLEEYSRVDVLISEMKQKSINLDLYSYNIWLSARGTQGSIEGMEEVYEEMKMNPFVKPNWTTFSTLATMYMKLGHLEEAQESLRLLESKITRRDRIPYHYLISLHGTVGNREEVYRVWNIYKTIFPTIRNWGYHAVISSLVRVGDIEGAEKIYEEWLSVKPTYDPKIGNLLIGWYVREGSFEKAKSFIDHMSEAGVRPNASTWELLAEGHMREKRASEALSCFKESALTVGLQRWKPKPVNVSAFLELCDEEEEEAGNNYKEEFLELIRQSGCLQSATYMSVLGGPMGTN